MPSRPEIGLGDLATVLGAMGLLDGGSIEDARRVARVLGVIEPDVPPRAPADPIAPIARGAAEPIVVGATGTSAGSSTAAATGAMLAAEPGAATSLSISLGARPTATTVAMAAPLPAPAGGDDDARLPLDPLFSPASQRSLVSTALATWQPDGDIDVDRVVDDFAARRPIVRIPRLRHATLRLGVQVLVDHGPAMEPFARDAAALVAQIRAIAGAHRVEVLRFAGDPLVCGPGPRRTWRPYRAPAFGVPVIAITDLGIAAPRLRLPSPIAAWHALAARIEEARDALLCIVPYPADRWPVELHDLRTIVWDRVTTVAHVQHLVRRAR